MVSKCANPECAASFLYFHTGKLFRIETSSGSERRRATMGLDEVQRRPLRRVEFFWLCENCAPKMTLVHDHETGVSVRRKAQAAAA